MVTLLAWPSTILIIKNCNVFPKYLLEYVMLEGHCHKQWLFIVIPCGCTEVISWGNQQHNVYNLISLIDFSVCSFQGVAQPSNCFWVVVWSQIFGCKISDIDTPLFQFQFKISQIVSGHLLLWGPVIRSKLYRKLDCMSHGYTIYCLQHPFCKL